MFTVPCAVRSRIGSYFDDPVKEPKANAIILTSIMSTVPFLSVSGSRERKQLTWFEALSTMHVAPRVYGLTGITRMNLGLDAEPKENATLKVFENIKPPEVKLVALSDTLPEIELVVIEKFPRM